MTPLTEVAHALIRSVLRPGDTAIDATVGNGHDTLVLAECVGPGGTVYGFDIQQRAIAATQLRLDAAGIKNVVLLNASHADMTSAIPSPSRSGVRAVMFNLGYLPGGDKRLTTTIDSTIPAIRAALRSLSAGGIITVMAYIGHAGGSEEACAVENLLAELPGSDFDVREEAASENHLAAPRLFVIRRR